jgi:hypothetical protein
MARKRRRSRGGRGKGGGGGALGSLRGGFRSVAHGATGVGRPGQAASPSRGGRIGGKLLTVILVAAVAFFLLRRFGVLRW